MGIGGIQFQRDLQLLIQNIEQKLERFRQGPAQRIPDALNAFAYKVRNFLIGGSTKGPSIVAAQRQQTPTVAERQADETMAERPEVGPEAELVHHRD